MGEDGFVTKAECRARHKGDDVRLASIELSLTEVAGDMKHTTGKVAKIAVDVAEMRGVDMGRREVSGEFRSISNLRAGWWKVVVAASAVAATVILALTR
uniref:Uncharacterized protein n=1 Tax=viral metagenome TaxID=1070528 RepID=A0A6H1ZFJ1_9ZZZZ